MGAVRPHSISRSVPHFDDVKNRSDLSLGEKDKIGNEAVRVSIAKILAQALTLIAAMLMSRFLTLEEYGTYSQVVLIITMLTSLIMLGLPNSMNYFMGRAEDDYQKREFLSVYYTLSTILCVVVGIISFVGTPWIIAYFNNPLVGTVWFFLLLYPFGRIITYTAENLYVAYHKTRYLLIFRVLYSACLVGTILVSHVLQTSFQMYMALFLSVSILFAIFVYISAYRLSGGIRFSFSGPMVKRILVFSIPLGLASAVGTINIELDKFMVGRFVDTSTLAIYTNASKEMPVTIIATALTAVMLPKFAGFLKEGKNREVVAMWGSATKISFIIMCYLAIGMFVFAPDCLRVLYSEKYVLGADVFRVYCIVLLMRATYFGIVLNSSGHSKLIFYSAVAALVLNCILNYLFYVWFGLIGPAIATFVSQVVINAFQLMYSARILKVGLKDIFPWKDLSIILIINIFLGCVFVFIKGMIPLDRFVGTEIESIALALVWGFTEIMILGRMGQNEWRVFNSLS